MYVRIFQVRCGIFSDWEQAAAATLEQSASQARIFESNDRSILSKSCLKQGSQGWAGVEAYGSVTRTCDLDIPRGHATVKCGMSFWHMNPKRRRVLRVN